MVHQARSRVYVDFYIWPLVPLVCMCECVYVWVCVCVCSASSVKAFEVLSAAVAAASARLFSVCSKETNTVRKSFGDISETEYWNCFIFDQNFL